MTFDEEWGKIRAGAASQQQDTHMRLNQADPLGPSLPGLPDLSSSPAEKKAAAKALEDHVEPDTKTAGEWVDLTTEEAEKEFKDWATGAGITAALKGWHASVKALRNRLSTEKTALRGTGSNFTGIDIQNGSLFSPYIADTDGKYPANTPYPSRVSQYWGQ